MSFREKLRNKYENRGNIMILYKNITMELNFFGPVGWGCILSLTASLQRVKTSQMSVLDMILNNLMASLQ